MLEEKKTSNCQIKASIERYNIKEECKYPLPWVDIPEECKTCEYNPYNHKLEKRDLSLSK